MILASVLLLVGCRSTFEPPAADADAYEAVLRTTVQEYRNLGPQISAPDGRTYCLAYQPKANAEYQRFSPSFMGRFSHSPDVRPASHCDWKPGRWIVVGPLRKREAVTDIWTLAKVTSDRGFSTCLRDVKFENGAWIVGTCKDGSIYN